MLPKEISQYDLVNLTIDFFNFEPLIIEKLERINQEKVTINVILFFKKKIKNFNSFRISDICLLNFERKHEKKYF